MKQSGIKRDAAVAVGGGLVGILTTFIIKAPKEVQTKLLDLIKYIVQVLGPLALVTVSMLTASVYMCFWCVKRMDARNEREVDRVAKERDEYQKMFIKHWQSTMERIEQPTRED